MTGNASKKLDLTGGLYPEAKVRPRGRGVGLQEIGQRGGDLPRGVFYQIIGERV